VLDLAWVYTELRSYYSESRSSIEPVLMIQMLIIGYVFAIRSEQICREVQVNLAYRWFCDLGLEDAMLLRAEQELQHCSPAELRHALAWVH
jgi:transposase